MLYIKIYIYFSHDHETQMTPFILLIQKRLQECVELLEHFKHGTLPPGVTDAQVSSALIQQHTTSFSFDWSQVCERDQELVKWVVPE